MLSKLAVATSGSGSWEVRGVLLGEFSNIANIGEGPCWLSVVFMHNTAVHHSKRCFSRRDILA